MDRTEVDHNTLRKYASIIKLKNCLNINPFESTEFLSNQLTNKLELINVDVFVDTARQDPRLLGNEHNQHISIDNNCTFSDGTPNFEL